MRFLFFFALLALVSFGLLKTGTISPNAVLYVFFTFGTLLLVLFWGTVLRQGKWRGVLTLLPVLLLAVGSLLAVCVGYEFGYPHQPPFMEWLRAPWVVPRWIIVASGGFVGLVAVSLTLSKGDCASCKEPIRPWQAAHSCGWHGSGASMHERCLLVPDVATFSSHDPAALAELIRMSQGQGKDQFSAASGTPQLRDDARPAVCGSCLRTQAMEALFLHCEHSDFLVPYENVIRHSELCSVCGCPAPEGPHDTKLVLYGTDATYAAGIEQEIERYKLGPLMACPHCDTRAHLMCWYAQGGCINRGNQGKNGRHCHMAMRAPQRPNFFEKGWPRLCAEHAKAKAGIFRAPGTMSMSQFRRNANQQWRMDMSDTEASAPTGMLVPWKLPDSDPVFLDDKNFYLLTDQAQMALARLAMARGVGAYWRDGDYRVPGLGVEARGEGLLLRVTGERYAGLTAAGMAVHGEPQEQLLPGPFADGVYVVGLRADYHPARSAPPELVVNRLPVGPAWLSFCLPLGFFQKRGRQIQRVYTDWDLRAVKLAELRAADGASREDRAYQLCQELHVQVRRLLPMVHERLRPLLEPLLLVSLLATLRDELSLAVRWKEVVRACRALEAVRDQFNPFDVRPAELLQADFGLVVAHFIEPALALLQWMKHTVGQMLAAAQADAEFPYDSFRSRWWTGLSVGDTQLLPALEVKNWGPSVLRAAKLISIGRHDAEGRRWEFTLDNKCHSFSENVVVVMVPSAEQPWDTRSVPIRIAPANSERPHHTLRFAAGRPWAAYWLPGGIKTMTDAVRITYQTPMPELSACLLWEVVACQS